MTRHDVQQAAGAGKRAVRMCVCLVVAVCCLLTSVVAQERASVAPLLDVPYISQSELLCGGAAAAMILRYWGERGIEASSFASLVDRSAAGIRTDALVGDLRRRGWTATAIVGSDAVLARELEAGRPALALIEDRPRTFHYIVIVGMTKDAIVFHDPARAPFRVMRRDELSRRWRAADSWMAVIVPRSNSVTPAPTATAGAPVVSTPCDALVADGVARAQAGDLDRAEQTLAWALACPGPSALRELAGVRALQKRWPEASELARAAIEQDRSDEYAWQLLATSEFVQEQRLAALDAWNAIGQPRLDLIRIDGLVRTRQRPVERLIDLTTHATLTRPALLRASRRLRELPAATSTRLTYEPVGSGLAEVHASVVEKPLLPRDPIALGTIGVSAVAARSIAVTAGSPTGGGEAVTLDWRFWPGRPRVGVELRAPAPFGGVWNVTASVERQPFDDPLVPTSRRAQVRIGVANWVTSAVRIESHAGLDRWKDTVDRVGSLGGEVRLVTPGDRVDTRIASDAWWGGERFASASATVRLRSSMTRQGFVVQGLAGGAMVSAATPADLWPAGDVGWVRPTLLRAHPIVTSGALHVDRLGRSLINGSVEGQRWWTTQLSLLRVGAAGFADSARTSQRLGRSPRQDLDVGAGARFAAAGLPGVLRIDVAHGLRDGANALSFVYAIE